MMTCDINFSINPAIKDCDPKHDYPRLEILKDTNTNAKFGY